MDFELLNKMDFIVHSWLDEDLFDSDVLTPIINLFSEYKTNYQRAPQAEAQKVLPPPPVDYVQVQKQPLIDVEPSDNDLRERAWMRNPVEWENPVRFEPLSQPVNGSRAPIGQEDLVETYIFVTPENQGAKCAICQGILEATRAPDGRFAYSKVLYDVNKGYVHKKCYESTQSYAAQRNSLRDLLTG